MIAYGYNDDGYYTNPVECPIDPLETKKAGTAVYILPANATYEQPLEPKEGFRVKFVDGAWTYEVIPEPEPEPEPTPEEIKQRRIFELKGLLQSTDYIYNVIREGDATEEDYAEVIANRKAWRAEVRELEAE